MDEISKRTGKDLRFFSKVLAGVRTAPSFC